ncbi:hypothetical protein [Paenibacillus hamazuiensis]|uniref:hypothetical protein n=1 Tax=Paenibacillus hamazuiensis TaxID=2936508 RepID=UPI00200CCA78|nr:hypothetical protein [Paenibacillus hamazuiensis]
MKVHKPKLGRPKLGIQGPVVAWQDPWAGEASERIMRTGTGSVCPSQDPKPEPGSFVHALRGLGADFYVHHVIPEMKGYSELLADIANAGMDICLGNEYGNINGPWAEGTNRYDVPDEAVIQAARSGRCIGLLYDEPEHLQINAGQYRHDGWFPHWGATDGLSLAASRDKVRQAAEARVRHVRRVAEQTEAAGKAIPLVSEHVFPTMFHTFARAGMDVCPKIMKESFQSLQLSTALGAAKQYGRALWICADLWGPDTGAWFTRFHGFPGHSPQEFASALRMGYLMGPTHLFAENIDVLLRHTPAGFEATEFGEVWKEFTGKFVPEHPLGWSHLEADPDIAVIHSDDGNYGQNERLFGNRELAGEEHSSSVFHIWHLLSRGTIPAHGGCMHIPGFEFPRHELKREVPYEKYPLEQGYVSGRSRPVHPLFYPVGNVLAFDEQVRADQLGKPKLVLAGGSSLSLDAWKAIVQRAEDGGTVIVARWLLPEDCPGYLRSSGKVGLGQWIVTDDFLEAGVKEAAAPFLGEERRWTQRFGNTEVRIYSADREGFTLDFEIVDIK